jgi:hypothetical protein
MIEELGTLIELSTDLLIEPHISRNRKKKGVNQML